MARSPSPRRSRWGLERWADGFFSISPEGTILVHPGGEGGEGGGDAIDLHAVVRELAGRGLAPPLLLRFPEIFGRRLAQLHGAFAEAIEENGYSAPYRGVYPIKVNQDRHVVHRLLEQGRELGFGLEAGSRPELLLAAALLADRPTASARRRLLVCNGYKDAAYVDAAIDAAIAGQQVVLVAESPEELALVAGRIESRAPGGELPDELLLGLRARLASPGSGRWEGSSGESSKFGFTGHDLLAALALLRERDLLVRLRLLHFHIGSQISSIRAVRDAIYEAAWIYANLAREGAGLTHLDVGGGLGVDYSGGHRDDPSSINYSLAEYAHVVVSVVGEVCERAGVEPPTLVSESGRATVAHHSVLILEVLGTAGRALGARPRRPPREADPAVHSLWRTYREVDEEGFLEAYHEAVAQRDHCLALFRLGHLSLAERALAGTLFHAVCRQVLAAARRGGGELPPELVGVDDRLAETYLCNFSVFQSLPDSWAVDQLFPVVPIHRLRERATARVVLADLTCDSDGKIDRFATPRGEARSLAIPPWRGEPYYLGIFLTGAYQEILGDLHNLFGDTHIAHVWRDGEGGFRIENPIPGESVADVLRFVHYRPRELAARYRRGLEAAAAAGRLAAEEVEELEERYREGLASYTYFTTSDG